MTSHNADFDGPGRAGSDESPGVRLPAPDTVAAGEHPFDPEPVLRHLTHRPGVYRMLDAGGQVIYVGKARNLRRRVGSYFHGRVHDAKTTAMVRVVSGIEVTVTRTEIEALMLECNLIKRFRPRFNVVLRDDKSYPYIHVDTDSEFPRLSFYRGSRTARGELFGPYPSAGAVRPAIQELQKVFKLRQCDDSYFANRSRPCLQYQIGRCSAPCVGLVSKEDYARQVDNALLFLRGRSDVVTGRLAEQMEQASQALDFEAAVVYRDQLARLRQLQSKQLMSGTAADFDAVGLIEEGGLYCAAIMAFRGGHSLGSRTFFPRVAADSDIEEVIRGVLLQYYAEHDAPREVLVSHEVPEVETLGELLAERSGHRVDIGWRLRGDRRRWVDMAGTNARQGAELKLNSASTAAAQRQDLAEALDLGAPPDRLECFDISHTGGEATVASCVVFGPEGSLKSDYRRFNIQGITAGDDYAAMNQALERRYARLKREDAALPDVLFIDGGRGQLAQAEHVLKELQIEGVTLVGVAKGEGRKPGRERLFVAGQDGAVRLSPSSGALHLVQQVRDEAHRFAITGHRAQRGRLRRTSPLEDIAGVGPKRRRALLKSFGGLQGITRASVDDLTRVEGISQQLAQSIYEHFHAG